MGDLLAALCLVLVIEGLLFLALPRLWREGIEHMRTLPDATLRLYGGIAAGAGLLLLQFVR